MVKQPHERKAVPEAPSNFQDVLNGQVTARDAYNEVAEKTFKDKGLACCPNCNRKFIPDSL